MKTNYVLIDYENVQVKSLSLLKGEHFQVKVFLGPTNKNLPVELVLAMRHLGERADYVVLETPGRNALDFHLIYYLGRLMEADPEGFFHIISKDTDYDSLLRHLKTRKILCVRSTSIEQMPCFAAPAGEDSNRQAAGSKPKPVPVSVPADLLRTAMDDLIRRKTSRPRTTKTLLSTLHATLGKARPAKDIQAVLDALVKSGHVNVNGDKVTYSFPAEARKAVPVKLVKV